jgi:hypothetical protein
MINMKLRPTHPGFVQVVDIANDKTSVVLLALDSMPWALDSQQPFPDDYADFVPMGQCPIHGLEPYRSESREVGTGYDICLASVFTCGELDTDTIF